MVTSKYMSHAIVNLGGLKLAPVGDTHPGSRVSAQETPMAVHLAFWQAQVLTRGTGRHLSRASVCVGPWYHL